MAHKGVKREKAKEKARTRFEKAKLQSTSRKDENIEHLKIHQVIGNQAWVPEGQTAYSFDGIHSTLE